MVVSWASEPQANGRVEGGGRREEENEEKEEKL
jgi:hypothetical protein